jgi:hypothetical protein
MRERADATERPTTVLVTDFYRPGDLQPDAETAAHASVPHELTFHVVYGPSPPQWTATCPRIAGFVAEGTQLGRDEIGAAILDQLADFRDPQP